MIEANNDQLLELQCRYNKKNYPLQFTDLKSEIDKVEHKLVIARQRYNDAVEQYSNSMNQIDIVRKEIQCFKQASHNIQKQLINTREDILDTKEVNDSVQSSIKQVKNKIRTVGKYQNKENYYFGKRMEETVIKLNQVRVANLKAITQQKNQKEVDEIETQAVDPIGVQQIRKQVFVRQLKDLKNSKQRYQRFITKLSDGFGQMLKLSKMQNVNQIVQAFAVSEENNSDLFSRLNFMSQQINELEEQSRKLQNEINEYNNLSENGEKSENPKFKQKDQLTLTLHQIEDLNKSNSNESQKLVSFSNEFDSLNPYVQNIINQLKILCEENDMLANEIQMDEVQLNFINLKQYLVFMEEKLQQLLSILSDKLHNRPSYLDLQLEESPSISQLRNRNLTQLSQEDSFYEDEVQVEYVLNIKELKERGQKQAAILTESSHLKNTLSSVHETLPSRSPLTKGIFNNGRKGTNKRPKNEDFYNETQTTY